MQLHFSTPTYQQPDTFKRSLLGINSHLYKNIKEGSEAFKQLWFSNYLEATTDDDPNVAQVTAYFRVARRTEILDVNFKPRSNKIKTGQVTHLVEKVVYGTEILCSIRKSVDPNRETKDSTERNIYLAAKNYFEKVIRLNLTNSELPVELTDVSCTIISSTACDVNGKLDYIPSMLRDGNPEKLRPVKVGLRQISEQFQNQLLADEKEVEIRFEKERDETILDLINNKIHILLNQPILDLIPPFKIAMDQFHSLMQLLCNEIGNIYLQEINVSKANLTAELIGRKTKAIGNLLADVVDWLIHRQRELENVTSLIDMQRKEIERDVKIDDENCSSKVLVLKVDYTEDSLMKSIQRTVGYQKPSFKFPVFPFAYSSGEEHLKINSSIETLPPEPLGYKSFNGENYLTIQLFPRQLGVIDNGAKYSESQVVQAPLSSSQIDSTSIVSSSLPPLSPKPVNVAPSFDSKLRLSPSEPLYNIDPPALPSNRLPVTITSPTEKSSNFLPPPPPPPPPVPIPIPSVSKLDVKRTANIRTKPPAATQSSFVSELEQKIKTKGIHLRK